ncbi:MAG: carboxylate-amine ligase [Rhodospirillaceae bacterium]|nr:carboxylate-amine ligase [Rhodospirillaceae bacterium]
MTNSTSRKRIHPDYALGIEEEYFIACKDTHRLGDRSRGKILKDSKRELGPTVTAEMLQSQIEVATQVLTTMDEGRRELAHARHTISEIAKSYGLSIAACGTHPSAAWKEQVITNRQRYREINEDLQIVGRRNMLCGLHVHVQMPGQISRIGVMNRMLPYLPLLLALSTSSPFWQSHNTGMKGYRLAAYDELPRTGIPPLFRDDAEYHSYVDALTTSGAIRGPSQFWWSIRPSHRFPTIELRIADSCTNLEHTLSIAALYRCLVRYLVRHPDVNAGLDNAARGLIEENKWRAQRFGVAGKLINLKTRLLEPVATLVSSLLIDVAEDARALECEREICGISDIIRKGSSADRQIQIFNDARTLKRATHRAAMGAVMDWLVEETLQLPARPGPVNASASASGHV